MPPTRTTTCRPPGRLPIGRAAVSCDCQCDLTLGFARLPPVLARLFGRLLLLLPHAAGDACDGPKGEEGCADLIGRGRGVVTALSARPVRSSWCPTVTLSCALLFLQVKSGRNLIWANTISTRPAYLAHQAQTRAHLLQYTWHLPNVGRPGPNIHCCTLYYATTRKSLGKCAVCIRRRHISH